jgi:DNA-binding winged helix-turn-helix (wHTH) protein/tetratricopeptide (TPR) repeat protein
LLSFPPFRLDLESERLWKDGEEVRLRRKPFAILRYLVHNPTRLVTHAEIVEAVWGKIAMSESLLRTHVRDLRQVLGDGLVETVVGRGYRFVAEIKHVELDGAPADRVAGPEVAGRLVVGRDTELETLRTALRSTRDRRRATLFISADAGMGKTTLVDAFLEQAGAQGPLLVGRGTCVEQYGSGQAYLPVLDAIAALCRGPASDRVLDVFSRLAPTWLAQLPSLVRPDRVEDLHRRAAGATQARTLRELAEALEALSNDAPVVLVLDDMQWTDPSTAELLAILAGRRDPARLLVLATYRPAEVTRGHPLSRVTGELVAHRQASVLALEGLGAEALAAYLARRFRGHRFPPGLTETIAQTTCGNPLFVTTLLDDLESQGHIQARDDGWELSTTVDDVAARRPDSIRRLIDTQIDRLAPVEQRIIEAAAVAGMTFTAGLVAHALDADADSVDSACESLASDRRLLQYLGTDTWPDGTIQSKYAFGHSLFQHAALKRSTSASIRAWHRKIAERLEGGYGKRTDEVAAELATHFDLGHQPAKAIGHYVAAGDRAGRRYGLQEAIAHYERARELVAGLPESPEREALELRALLRLGWRVFQREGKTDGALGILEKTRALAARVDDKEALAEALIRLEAISMVRGDLRKATEYAQGAAPLLDRLTDAALRVHAKELEAATVLLRGELSEACRLLDELGAFRTTDDSAAQGSRHFVARALAAYASWLVGKPDQSLAIIRRARQIAEALDDPWERAAILSDSATVHAWRREPAEAEELARRSLALAQPGAFGLWRNRANLVLRWAEAELSASVPDERIDQLIGEPREDVSFGRTMPTVLFAAMCARLGRTERALEVVSDALASIERSGERWLEPELHRLRGTILAPRDALEAERSIARGIELAREQSSASLELRALVSLHALVSGAKKKQVKSDVARVLSLIAGGEDTPDVLEARKIAGI